MPLQRAVAPAALVLLTSASAAVGAVGESWHDALPEVLLGLLATGVLTMVAQTVRLHATLARLEQRLVDHIANAEKAIVQLAALERRFEDVETRFEIVEAKIAGRIPWNGSERRGNSPGRRR